MSRRKPAVDVTTLAELMDRLGNVPLERVRVNPPPGTATERDLLRMSDDGEDKLLELIDGVLIRKAPGFRESLLGGVILAEMWNYLKQHNLGKALPGNAHFRL